VTQRLVGSGLAQTVHANGWFLLAPIAVERASYSPIVFLGGVAAGILLGLLIARRLYRGTLRRAEPWACGYAGGTARMQDTAEGFGQPIRQIFEPFFRLTRDLPSPFDARPHYRVVIEDRFWHGVYLPIARLVDTVARGVGLLQQGRISIYLLYSFVTLVVLLMLVRL